MDESEVTELKGQIDNIVYARTKNDAKPLYKRLVYKTSNLEDEITPYHLGKLREAIDFAMEASGQVNDKEHWRSCMESSWYVFKNGVVN
jgi:hypothetical protein